MLKKTKLHYKLQLICSIFYLYNLKWRFDTKFNQQIHHIFQNKYQKNETNSTRESLNLFFSTKVLTHWKLTINHQHTHNLMSWKLNVLYITYIYYIVWIGLPIFFSIDPETNTFQKHIYLRDEILFPFKPSVGILIPILIMLVGLMIIGTFLGVLCINQQRVINKRKLLKKKA